MEEDFRALLLNDSGVSALAGSRVNWGAHPQGQPLPGVVLHVIGGNDEPTLEAPDGLTQGRVQVDCYADTIGGAVGLGRAVRAALNGHKGGDFQGIFHAATRTGREGGGDTDRPFYVQLDFTTHYQE